MPDERRTSKRYAYLAEGSWRGGSGGAPCRFADISLGGCFIETLATPVLGEETTVTFNWPENDHLSLPGVVVYSERGIGFSVKFVDLPQEAADRLAALIEELERKQATT